MNGSPRVDEFGKTIMDANGDTVYYTSGGRIAYDKEKGIKAYAYDTNGNVQTKPYSAEELAAHKESGSPEVLSFTAEEMGELLEDSGIPQEVLKEEKAEVYEQLSEVNRNIRAERGKLKLCREICRQTPAMEQDIQKTEEHQKEVREHEHRRR